MELLDLYNIQGEKLGKTIERGNKPNDNEYIKLATVWIKNDIRFLIQKCSEEKGGEYAVTGGHVTAGNTSLQQAIIESKEELDIELNTNDLEFLGSIYRGKAIFDVYLYEDEDYKLSEHKFNLQKSEVEDICWLSKNDIEDLIIKNEFRESSAEQYFKFIKNI